MEHVRPIVIRQCPLGRRDCGLPSDDLPKRGRTKHVSRPSGLALDYRYRSSNDPHHLTQRRGHFACMVELVEVCAM